jgi:hypothetical protein
VGKMGSDGLHSLRALMLCLKAQLRSCRFLDRPTAID